MIEIGVSSLAIGVAIFAKTNFRFRDENGTPFRTLDLYFDRFFEGKSYGG